MSKYKYHSLALNPDEEEQFKKAKANGYGIKKIFKAMLDALVPKTKIKEEEEI